MPEAENCRLAPTVKWVNRTGEFSGVALPSASWNPFVIPASHGLAVAGTLIAAGAPVAFTLKAAVKVLDPGGDSELLALTWIWYCALGRAGPLGSGAPTSQTLELAS